MRGFFLMLLGFLVPLSGWAKPIQHAGPVTWISFSEEKIYSCSQKGVFSGVGPKLNWIFTPDFRVTSFHVHPEDLFLFLAGGKPGESGEFAVYHIESGEVSVAEKIADDMVYALATTNEHVFFAAEIAVREFSRLGLQWRHTHTAATRTVVISPNERFLASTGMDRVVILSEWKVALSQITIQDHTAAVDCLAFSPDSTRFASGARDGKVRIHAAPEGKLVRTYSHLDGEVSALAWSDAQLLAGTSEGKIYRLDPGSDSSTAVADWGKNAPITALAINGKEKVFAGTLNRIAQVEIDD